MSRLASLLLAALFLTSFADADDGKRLTYLDENNPCYPHASFPKLITPQWVGEEGVEAVVVLAIDDMRDPAKYERYLRPILQRLKAIDGRAPVSIMTCSVKPDDPQLQAWRDEGLSIEVHTIDHPCPLLNGGDFPKAKSTYDRCVDLLHKIPTRHRESPVAFRMPCCDSLNTVSPRFFSEIFNRTTPDGHFLSISSSVFNVFTPADKSIPRDLLFDADGRERFRKYIPHQNGSAPRNRFNNFIENYPYPYVVNRMCWEFPCVVPSDWEAQHLHQPNNPVTVTDMKTALDITVQQQGVYCLVFHPHGWIKNSQVVDIIDHAVKQHGTKVKFLTFPESLDRINRNLLGSETLRDPQGGDNGVRLVDVNQDGYQDVVIGNARRRETRVWNPQASKFEIVPHFAQLTGKQERPQGEVGQFVSMPDVAGLKFVQLSPSSGVASGGVSLFLAQRFQNGKWTEDAPLKDLLHNHIKLGQEHPDGNLVDVLFRELTKNGSSLALVTRKQGDVHNTVVLHWSAKPGEWQRLRAQVPTEIAGGLAEPGHPRVRFVDIDEDGDDDCVLSPKQTDANPNPQLRVWLMDWFATGKAIRVTLPDAVKTMPIVRADGSDNGFFVRDRHLCWQNEDTDRLPHLLHRVSFDAVLQDHIDNAAKQGNFPPPRTPEQSAALIQVRPGLRVELVAAEPLIRDPVAFDWDITGRLWVVEMGDYPSGATDDGTAEGGKTKGGGRVRVLEDSDHDGRFDRATTFIDGLQFPTGIQLWRNGVLICAAPEIFYAEDSDGDGKADVRKTLYRGFGEGNQQHRVNGLRLGLDNWLYIGNGDSGGKIEAVQALIESNGKLHAPVAISGRDLRIRPDQGLMDPQSGQTQFGRNRDDWGNWFGCNNSNPMWHYVLADHYLRRNPHAVVKSTRHVVPGTPGAAPVFPISRTLPRFNDFGGVNRFTSACSTMIYRDRLLGEQFYGNAFTSEPVHNLISRLVLTPDGVTFKGQRAADETNSEFLASRDNWFRPTMIRTGPDGALWFADMYRAVIEHPKWIPPEWQAKLDLRAGHTMGRIYRVVSDAFTDCCRPNESPNAPVHPTSSPGDTLRCYFDKDAAQVSSAELISRLASPNGWWRDAAQRILVQRQADKAVVSNLVKMANEHESPLARLHAICTLDGLDALGNGLQTPPPFVFIADGLRARTTDSHPGVRRHAIRLIEKLRSGVHGSRIQLPVAHPDEDIRQRMRRWNQYDIALRDRLLDPDPQVRLQLAYSAGAMQGELRHATLGRLLRMHHRDPWLNASILSSLTKDDFPAIIQFADPSRHGMAPSRELTATLIGQAAAFEKLQSMENAILALLPDPLPVSTTESPLKKNNPPFSVAAWQTLTITVSEIRRHPKAWKTLMTSETFAKRFNKSLADAVRVAVDVGENPASRVLAVQFAGLGGLADPQAVKLLSSHLTPQSPDTLQQAIVTALAAHGDQDAPQQLLAGWRAHSPRLRTAILDALLEQDRYRDALLEHIESGQIGIVDVDAVRRERLLTTGSKPSRARAAKLFAVSATSTRQAVIAQFQNALKLKGDLSRGRQVFEKRCAICHKLGGIGKSIGADLTSLRDRSGPALLIAILDPNRAVESKFLSFTAVTAAGRTFSGMLLAETGTSITLISPDGKEHVIRRTELETLVGSNRSLMPEGFERDMSQQDLSDVITFVQSTAVASKKFPNNQPRTIEADKENSLTLPAGAAEIFGPTLVFEQQFKNLGFWSSREDYAAWTINVRAAGRYSVQLDYAVETSCAGDELHLAVGGTVPKGRVPSTERWDNYQSWNFGTIELPARTSRLVVSTPVKPRQALIDLRTIRLRLVR
ncbi:MAG: c-type cytochrome [Planctomycetota bacterium]|nr:c-type cytochrome [Planctomycetota bacterium]